MGLMAHRRGLEGQDTGTSASRAGAGVFSEDGKGELLKAEKPTDRRGTSVEVMSPVRIEVKSMKSELEVGTFVT